MAEKVACGGSVEPWKSSFYYQIMRQCVGGEIRKSRYEKYWYHSISGSHFVFIYTQQEVLRNSRQDFFIYIVTAHSRPPDGHPEIFRDEAARKTRIKMGTPFVARQR